jgi:formylglycine-generating enzyme required for sulfatase activity
MLNRRYPGVSPFTKEQRNIFFGRDNDIKKLHKLISMRKQVLLYSKSGIGKTSLLNAGVLPKLDEAYTIINIRFFAYDEKSAISPVDKTFNSLQNILNHENNPFLEELLKQTSYAKTLWYYFKQLQFSGKQKFILVFDQFEELFSYPETAINQFKEELHELTNIDIPNEIKQKIAEKEAQDDDQIDLLYKDMEIKTVFAIRSDRLSLLNKLADKIPDIQETFYELIPLDDEQTKSAILQPAMDKSGFETKAFGFSEDAMDAIISALTDKGKQNIETTQLQIVCQRIEDIAQEKYKLSLNPEPVIITRQDLPEFKNIFLSFYDETINEVTKDIEGDRQAISRNNVRRFIDDHLIRNNQRISLDAIICSEYVSKDILNKLVNTHLLRAERNSTGGFSYELSHDTLIVPILISRKERVEKEEKARVQAKQLKELRKLKKEKEREENERRKVQVEKDRADKLLEKSRRLLHYLVPENTLLIYKYFEEKAEEELNKCQFELAAQYFLFAWLAFDLPESLDTEIKQRAEIANKLTNCNLNAIEHYRNFRKREAENEYEKILQEIPGNHIILKRIEYCRNPVFKKENFVLVKGGTFTMGDGSDNDNPKHIVSLSDFYMGKYQVTNEEYAEFLNIYGSDLAREGEYKGENMIDGGWLGIKKNGYIWEPYDKQFAKHPIVRVSWYGAYEFSKFWNASLPSEAQWEFAACCGGKNYKYSWGNAELQNSRNSMNRKFGNIADETFHKCYPNERYEKGFDDGFPFTSPVGSFDANEIGLFDMSGNVWEWCMDWYDKNFYKNSWGQINPICMQATQCRVDRGGSWGSNAEYCRVTNRGDGVPARRNEYLGFRLAFVH